MLIPFLSINPREAARQVPNSHCIKLISESYTIFMAALGQSKGWHHHPYTIWVRSSSWAWDWLYEFAEELATQEHPRRYGKYNSPSGNGIFHKDWYKIKEIKKPDNFLFNTQEETPLCPLPKAMDDLSQANDHGSRVEDFKEYYRQYKNKDSWRFLWEPRTTRPEWMPKRNLVQDEIVEKTAKRIKV